MGQAPSLPSSLSAAKILPDTPSKLNLSPTSPSSPKWRTPASPSSPWRKWDNPSKPTSSFTLPSSPWRKSRKITPEPILSSKANPIMFKSFLQSIDRAELGELLRACERYEQHVDLLTLGNANQSMYKQEQNMRETRRLAQRVYNRFLYPRAERFVVEVPKPLSTAVNNALRGGGVINRSTFTPIKFVVDEILSDIAMLNNFSEWIAMVHGFQPPTNPRRRRASSA